MTDLAVYQPPTPALDPGSPEGVAWFDATLRQAEYLAGSQIVPDAYRGKPADIVVAAMYGRDFGWSATMAMTHIHVVKGKPSLSAQSMVALVRGAGHSIAGDATATGATVHGRRADTGDEMTVEFGPDDAKRAGLNSQTWRSYPQSMFWARAVSQLCRMLFADVLLGLSYTPEELEGIPDHNAAEMETRSDDQLERDRLLAGLQERIADLGDVSAWEEWKANAGTWWRSVDTIREATEFVLGLLAASGVEPFESGPSVGPVNAASALPVDGGGGSEAQEPETSEATGQVESPGVVELPPPSPSQHGEGNDTESESGQSVADGVVCEPELARTGGGGGVPSAAAPNPIAKARKAAR